MRSPPFLSFLACYLTLAGPRVRGQEPELPEVPGFEVTVFARVPDPVNMTIDPRTGTLYLGRGDDGAPIYRIRSSGLTDTYGPAIFDPDAVFFDAVGDVSGIPGAVIVGGATEAAQWGTGKLFAIPPGDPSRAIPLCGELQFSNLSDIGVNPAGELLVSDEDGSGGWIKHGCSGAVLTPISGRSGNFAVDSHGMTYVRLLAGTGGDGSIWQFQSNGALDRSFNCAGDGDLIVVGQGGPWEDHLFANDESTGNLLRIDPRSGECKVAGTGFAEIRDGCFGPDGALYLVDRTNNRILRICQSAGTTVTFADGDFKVGEWEVATLTTGGGGEVTASRDESGGNPDGFRRITNSLNGSPVYNNLFGFHRRVGASHDPRTGGAISSLDYSEDFVCFEDGGGDCQSTGPALRQGGQVYILDWHRAYVVTPVSSWTSVELTGLGALDFIRLDPSTDDPLNGIAVLDDHPDFTLHGGPIDFGFFRGNSSGAVNGVHVTVAGIDNWRVVVHACGPVARQLPGDCNQDGRLDISDGVCVFRTLFIGDPQRFPCGDGSARDPDNLALLDWRGDGGELNIADGVALLEYLFRDGPPHVRAVPGLGESACIPLVGCHDVAACGR